MDIQLYNLWKIFDEKVVLGDFSATIPEGKTTALMGPSGIGKTTLIRILGGLEECSDGKISGLSEKKISMVFQENRLIAHYSGLENVELIPTTCSREEIEALFTTFQLESEMKAPVSTYSGGMKRRVALIRALIADFDLLLLDEPFSGLDRTLMEVTVEAIQRFSQGKTLLFTSHKEEEIQLLSPENIITLQ